MLRLDGFEFIEDDAEFIASQITALGQREELLFWAPLDRILLAKKNKSLNMMCMSAYRDVTVDDVVVIVANKMDEIS